MSQKQPTRYFSKDVTIVMTFKRLQSDVDGADSMARDLLVSAVNNRLNGALVATGYKVNQIISTEDWDIKTKEQMFLSTPAFIKKRS